jgi:hypothetical protein
MQGPTFPTLDAAGRYGLANKEAGLCASFRLRRVIGQLHTHDGETRMRLAAIRYAAVLQDKDGRTIEEACA